jgi:hypothetical protein
MSQKEWTIMIYMAGDNNLAVDMAYAMEQIKGVAGEGADSPNLFVYYDGNSPSIPTLYCDFSKPQYPKYVRAFTVPDKLYDVPDKQNENAADDKSVLNFVDWCVNKVEVVNGGEITYGRRANRYALIFSGHSLGFQDIGLFRDETSGKAMKMTDLYYLLRRLTGDEKQLKEDIEGWGLRGIKRERETEVLLGQKLDILGFDSCVMGMLEVGYQFNDVATVMISSEGSVPSAGWTYAKILGSLTRKNGNDGSAQAVAENFVRQFIESQDSYTVGGVSVDMAAWDLCCLRDLATAFDGLSTALINCFEDPESRVYRQMERVILQVHWKCQSYMYDQNVDLGDFCELLDVECGRLAQELGDGEDLGILRDVQEMCQTVLGELKKAVILSGFSGGGYQYSNGMSVFFPWSREGYEVSSKNYKALWFAKESGTRKFYWNGFLTKYLNEVALRRSEPLTANAAPGSKYRYKSGIKFHESHTDAMIGDNGEGSKIAGHEGSKLAGHEGSKLAGHEGSKLAGHEGSKLAGHEGSKLAGHEGSKLAGHEGSKLAGHEGSKLAGHEGSKLAGGGSNAFFENLKLFKNIESRWDISGFTKRAAEQAPESEAAEGSTA